MSNVSKMYTEGTIIPGSKMPTMYNQLNTKLLGSHAHRVKHTVVYQIGRGGEGRGRIASYPRSLKYV